MTETADLRVKIVRQLVRKNVVGGHEKQVDTVKNWFPSSDQGRVEELIREMIRDPEAPLEGYGGARDNVRLTRVEAAAEYIVEHGGDLPWGSGRTDGERDPSERAPRTRSTYSFEGIGSAVPVPVSVSTYSFEGIGSAVRVSASVLAPTAVPESTTRSIPPRRNPQPVLSASGIRKSTSQRRRRNRHCNRDAPPESSHRETAPRPRTQPRLRPRRTTGVEPH